MSEKNQSMPFKQRYLVIDALRGIALLGICLANYPEFSLYSFLDTSVTSAMSTSGIDKTVRCLQYIFIEGKFYTLFSVLFGMGFHIIISNSEQKAASAISIFYRRMTVLLLFGLCHLLFLWAGDILVLYAFLGFFLPLLRNTSDKKLLAYSAVFLLLPIFSDFAIEMSGWNPAACFIEGAAYFHRQFGITTANFPVWLAQQQTYEGVLKFNVAGSFIRMQEFIEGSRPFKVMGLFLLGFYIGRKRLFANIENSRALFEKVCFYGFATGLPLSLLFACSAMNSRPMGLTVHSVLYTASVLPLSLAYASAFCLLYSKRKNHIVFRVLAAPGKMALTSYIMQSVLGIVIFYGVGYQLGASLGLVYVECIALGIFILQTAASLLWLQYFGYGPLEWLWRMLSYGKWLKISR